MCQKVICHVESLVQPAILGEYITCSTEWWVWEESFGGKTKLRIIFPIIFIVENKKKIPSHRTGTNYGLFDFIHLTNS